MLENNTLEPRPRTQNERLWNNDPSQIDKFNKTYAIFNRNAWRSVSVHRTVRFIDVWHDQLWYQSRIWDRD
jgi:hypothetical protein